MKFIHAEDVRGLALLENQVEKYLRFEFLPVGATVDGTGSMVVVVVVVVVVTVISASSSWCCRRGIDGRN